MQTAVAFLAALLPIAYSNVGKFAMTFSNLTLSTKLVGALCFAILAGSVAQAAPVPIANFSFEDFGTAIPGWRTNRTGGANVIGDTNETDGVSALYLNAGNGAFQPLDGMDRAGAVTSVVLLTDNTQYSLAIDVGQRDNQGFNGWVISLQALNPTTLAYDTIAELDAASSGLSDPGRDNYVEANLDFLTGTSPILGSDGTDLRGQPIGIRLSGGTGIQTMFDNVRLDVEVLAVEPVPEPASLAVWGLLGAAAFAYSRRRRRR